MVARCNRVPKNGLAYLNYLTCGAREIDPDFEVRAYGQGARHLGIHGRPLTPIEVQNLIRGYSPDGKHKLGRSHRYRRWGFEVLFSAPSRVSAAIAVLEERKARAAFKATEKAAHDTVAALEKRYAYARVTERGVTRRERVGLIYLTFTHGQNRSSEVNAHVHAVALNQVLRGNGTWAALENAHVFKAQKPLHRIFNQALAYHFERDVGLRVARTKKSIRVVGVDAQWAKTERREQIKRALGGNKDPAAATHAALETRQPKQPLVLDRWLAECRKKAHAAGHYAADLKASVRRTVSDRIQDHRANRCYRLAAKYVRENVTSFSAAKVDEVAALFATGRNIAPDRLMSAGTRFRENPHRYGVVQTHELMGEPLYTSRVRPSREEKLYAELARMSKKKRGGLSDRQIASALAGSARVNRESLLKVQMLAARSGVTAGESTTLRDPDLKLAVLAYRRNNRPVIAIGSNRADANRLHQHLDVKSYTASEFAEERRPPGHWQCLYTALRHGKGCLVQRLGQAERMRRDRLKLPKKCVVVVDLGREDVMELQAVVKAVREAKGKIVTTGSDSLELRANIERHLRGESLTPAFRPAAHDQDRSEDRRLTRSSGRRSR